MTDYVCYLWSVKWIALKHQNDQILEVFAEETLRFSLTMHLPKAFILMCDEQIV